MMTELERTLLSGPLKNTEENKNWMKVDVHSDQSRSLVTTAESSVYTRAAREEF